MNATSTPPDRLRGEGRAAAPASGAAIKAAVLRGRSVRAKITALVVASTLAALLLTALALIIYTTGDYRRTQLADVRTQADLLARASAPALAFNDRNEAVQNLALLKARTDIEQAALYGPDGRLFAAYAREGAPLDLPQRAEGAGQRIEGDRLLLFQPVREGGQFLGTVYLESRHRLDERMVAYVSILAAVMAVALIAALALSAWLQRALTDPIERVSRAARAVVERNDFSVRAVKTSEDEIGALTDAFNHMLEEIDRRTKAVAESEQRFRTIAVTARETADALRLADRRKDEFLATLAHELRNPLAPVRNALYLMKSSAERPAVVAEARAMIERNIDQMVRLVDDLLDVSRITTGKLVLKRERADLRAVLAAAVEAAMPLLRGRGHAVNVELPPAGVSINADATRLVQVFQNLLNNAAKFTPAGGQIDFSAAMHGSGTLVASVRDNGVGIAPQMRAAIFEMFVQADRSLERTSSGLGVGLSLARRLVELHGGTLEAKSDGPGRGSEFTVRIPGLAADPSSSR